MQSTKLAIQRSAKNAEASVGQAEAREHEVGIGLSEADTSRSQRQRLSAPPSRWTLREPRRVSVVIALRKVDLVELPQRANAGGVS